MSYPPALTPGKKVTTLHLQFSEGMRKNKGYTKGYGTVLKVTFPRLQVRADRPFIWRAVAERSGDTALDSAAPLTSGHAPA
jgi:hypothetical protein